MYSLEAPTHSSDVAIKADNFFINNLLHIWNNWLCAQITSNYIGIPLELVTFSV